MRITPVFRDIALSEQDKNKYLDDIHSALSCRQESTADVTLQKILEIMVDYVTKRGPLIVQIPK